jgi:hypothetical protein
MADNLGAVEQFLKIVELGSSDRCKSWQRVSQAMARTSPEPRSGWAVLVV